MDQKPLQERCLEVIIEHLDRFSYAFNTTKSATLKRNFEFLQRCYSNEILLQVLSTLDIVNEDYFPLLINKYLRELNLSILDQTDGETITRIIAEVGEGLLKISFSTSRNIYPDPPFANIFPHLKNITILNMETTCNDEALKNITKYCPHLVELNMTNSRITNEGLKKYFCQKNEGNEVPNSNLRKLCLYGTDINDDLTELILMSFPHLEELETPSMPCVLHKMHQRDICIRDQDNLKQYKLTHLDVLRCTHLTSSPELLKLYTLLCPDVSDLTAIVTNSDHLSALATFTKLKNMILVKDELFPHPVINNFLNSRGAGLKVLNLTGFCLSVEQLIKSCPLLEELHLKDINFQPVAETGTKELKFLKKFYLERAYLIDAETSKSVCTIICSARKLEEISFSFCTDFTDEFKEAIMYCCVHCPLKEVNFSQSESDLVLLQSILFSSCTLKVLRIVSHSFGIQNLKPDDIDLLVDIASNLKNKPKIEYEEEESDFNSDSDLDEVLELNDEFDFYDNYTDGDYDNYDDYGDYDNYDDYGEYDEYDY